MFDPEVGHAKEDGESIQVFDKIRLEESLLSSDRYVEVQTGHLQRLVEIAVEIHGDPTRTFFYQHGGFLYCQAFFKGERKE